jgi:hypothetical protein
VGAWNNTSRDYWIWYFFWKRTTTDLKILHDRVQAACSGGCSQPPKVERDERGYELLVSSEQVELQYLDDARDLLDRRLAGQGTGLGLAPSERSWTIGVSSGFCIFICLELGISSGGVYARPGIGFAVDSPGVVVDVNDAPECGTEQTLVYLSAGIGPPSVGGVQATAGYVSKERSGNLEGFATVSGLSFDDGGSTPHKGVFSFGFGTIHTWDVC